jgi:uncharacterized membrane protein YhaH (DUF805 family)
MTIMMSPVQRDPGRPGADAARANDRPWLLTVTVPLVITAILMINRLASDSGSWPDWAYVLILMASLITLVAVVVQRRRAKNKHS